MNGLIFILWIILCGLIYIPTGVLLIYKSNRKSIRNRSPLFVSIAHWSNLTESVFLLVALYRGPSNSLSSQSFDQIFRIVTIIVHYSYFISYVLRCYRVYFIFHLDYNRDESDSFFNKNIHRAGQKWLFKVFIISLWPVIIIGALIALIPELHSYFQSAYFECEEPCEVPDGYISEGIYLFILFIEEIVFMVSVFKLRHIKDDFGITVEMSVVCALWIVTGMVSIFNDIDVWLIEVIARNHLIMCISSIYPVFKSFNAESFEEIITLEMLQSLELILQSEVILNSFEKVIKGLNARGFKGGDLLDLWLKCENFRFKETLELKKEIMECAKNLKMHSKTPNGVSFECFHILNQYFLPVFRDSIEYKQLIHETTQQQIYMNRLMQTSLVGGQNDPVYGFRNKD